MIEQVLELYPVCIFIICVGHSNKLSQAIDVLLNKVKYKDIHQHLLDDMELCILQNIANFLKVPHAVQTMLCAEKTPPLSAVLPTYEDLLVMLNAYKAICQQLKHAIMACISKIEDYVKKSQKTCIYALAMGMYPFFYVTKSSCCIVINPMTKLKWIEEHWMMEEYHAAKEWMLGAVSHLLHFILVERAYFLQMFEYQKENRHSSPISQSPLRSGSVGPSTASAQSQASGLAYIHSLKANLQHSASSILAGPAAAQDSTSPQDTNIPELTVSHTSWTAIRNGISRWKRLDLGGRRITTLSWRGHSWWRRIWRLQSHEVLASMSLSLMLNSSCWYCWEF